MGNPRRYKLNGIISVSDPLIDEERKEVCFAYFDGEIAEAIEVGVVDFYSAPDVIMQYTNFNTNKDEFRRYIRWTFSGMKLLEHHEKSVKYSYENVTTRRFSFGDREMETDIPIGKFSGLTYEQVQEYKKLNFVNWGKDEISNLGRSFNRIH